MSEKTRKVVFHDVSGLCLATPFFRMSPSVQGWSEKQMVTVFRLPRLKGTLLVGECSSGASALEVWGVREMHSPETGHLDPPNGLQIDRIDLNR